MGLDWRVLAFTILVAGGDRSSVWPDSRPANLAARFERDAQGKQRALRHRDSARTKRAPLLVVSEIALAVVLLVGAALLIRTFLAFGRGEPGFDADNVLTMRMSLTGQRFAKSAGYRAAGAGWRGARQRAARSSLSPAPPAASHLEGGYGLPFLVVGRPLTDGPFHGGGGWLTVSPGYFEVFKIPVMRGRAFTERDDGAAPPVVVINQAMAKRFWPKGDPLSDKIWIGKGMMTELAAETPRQIIGIVGDVRGMAWIAIRVPPCISPSAGARRSQCPQRSASHR